MMNKAKYKRQLEENIKETAAKSLGDEVRVVVAFSGGLDSSLLAKVFQDLGVEVNLLTIGFPGASDIEWARKISRELSLPLEVKELNRDDLRIAEKELAGKIDFPGVRDFEIALSLYVVFKFAAELGFENIATATGLDALFCGFDKTRRVLAEEGREGLEALTREVVEHAQLTEKVFVSLAADLELNKINPFMEADFIERALQIPSELKIIDTDDLVRKHILREVAMDLDVPESAAMRPKKAIQYSTKIDRNLKKIAKNEDFTNREEYLRKAVYEEN